MVDIQNLYVQLIKDVANELVKNKQYDLLELIIDRMEEIKKVRADYIDYQLSILENQSPE